jgi:hypothetical protein
MDSNRLFLFGVILLLLGVQFRMVESFELNAMATRFVEKRFPSRRADSSLTNYVSQDSYADPWVDLGPADPPTTRSFSPPRQLAFSFISVGAILILVSPVYRK